MDKYQVHTVTIRKEDYGKADEILEKHYMMGDIDDIKVDEYTESDGTTKVNFRISPFIYEDLQTIISEFKQSGIQVL